MPQLLRTLVLTAAAMSGMPTYKSSAAKGLILTPFHARKTPNNRRQMPPPVPN